MNNKKPSKKITTHKLNNGEIVWRCTNSSSSYTFNNPNKSRKLTKGFLKYLINNQISGETSTKKGFYKFVGKELNNGNCSTFFSSIKESGIVNVEKVGREYVYTIGENFHHYLNGNVRRYNWYKDGYWNFVGDIEKSIGKELKQIGLNVNNGFGSKWLKDRMSVVNNWMERI